MRRLNLLYIPIVLGGIFWGGCAKFPRDVDSEYQFTQTNLESIEETYAQTLSHTEWPQENWWESFADPELNRWVEAGLAHNPSIASIERQVQAAEQWARAQKGALFPQMDFIATYDVIRTSRYGLFQSLIPGSPVQKLSALFLSFDYDFDLWGKTRNLYYSKIHEAYAKETEAKMQKLIISLSISQAYFNCRIGQKKIALVQQLLDLEKKQGMLLEMRNQQGIDSSYPLIDVKSRIINTEKQWQQLRSMLTIDQYELNTLAVLPLHEPLPESAWEIHLTPYLPKDLSLSLIGRRPDIAAQIWKIQSKWNLVASAKAAFYPDLNFFTLLGLEALQIRHLLDPHSFTALVAPALLLPVFHGGSLRATYRARKQEFEAEVDNYNQLILKAAQEVASSLEQWTLNKSLYERQTESVQLALDRKDLSEGRYRAGLISELSVIDDQIKALREQLGQLEIQNSQLILQLQLIKALGGGYEFPHVPSVENPS